MLVCEMMKSEHLNNLSPANLRLLIRQKDPRIKTTTGLANGKRSSEQDRLRTDSGRLRTGLGQTQDGLEMRFLLICWFSKGAALAS